MFGKKKQPPIKSLIAQGSCIEGNLKFTDGLRIDGEVIGDIRAVDGSSSILMGGCFFLPNMGCPVVSLRWLGFRA